MLRNLPSGLDAAAVLARAGIQFPFRVLAMREPYERHYGQADYTWHADPRCDDVSKAADTELFELGAAELETLNDAVGSYGCSCAPRSAAARAWLAERAELAGLLKALEYAAYWAPDEPGYEQGVEAENAGWLKVTLASYGAEPPVTADGDQLVNDQCVEALAALSEATAGAGRRVSFVPDPSAVGNERLVRVRAPIHEVELGGSVLDTYYRARRLFAAAGAYTTVGISATNGWPDRLFLIMPAGVAAWAIDKDGGSVLGPAQPATDTVESLNAFLDSVHSVAAHLRGTQKMNYATSETVAISVMAERHG